MGSDVEVTEADREKAGRLLHTEHGEMPSWVEGQLRVVVAQALADERAKARAPFLALAEELEREGRNEEAQAQKLGKSITAESWWGSGAASLDAAARIRRAAEEG